LAAAFTVPPAVPQAEIPPGATLLAHPLTPVAELTTAVWEPETAPARATPQLAAGPAPQRPPVLRTSGAVPSPAKATGAAPATPAAAPAAPAAPDAAGAADSYWVQVGAYRDAEMARRVAQRLREQNYPVRESVVARPSAGAERPAEAAPAAGAERDRYEVIVTGGSPSEVQARLSSKGLTSRPEAQGAAVTPALSLGEAVALSRDLSESGLPVRVRRIPTVPAPAVAPPAAPRAAAAGEGDSLYRVRVGGFADRAAAVAALKELEARGFKPFLARGND
jgi:cell division septation protein DedD